MPGVILRSVLIGERIQSDVDAARLSVDLHPHRKSLGYCWPRGLLLGLNSRICHHRLALAGLYHHEARAVEGQLEGLARATPNEGAHLEGALDLRLQVRRPADRRLRGSKGRLLRVGQTRQHPVIGTRYRLILRWCLVGAR